MYIKCLAPIEACRDFPAATAAWLAAAVALSLAFAGCATAPSGAVSTTASNSGASPAGTHSNLPPAAAPDKLATLQNWARNSGYKPYSKEGRPFWCKDEAILGSHLSRVRCVSEEALTDLRQQSLDSQQSLSERERICAGGSCNNSK